MDTDIRALLDKTPLAEAVWLLWHDVLPEQTLDDFYVVHRERCYQRAFSFANLVYLVSDALLQHGGSGQQTLLHHAGSKQCPASDQAFYGKLRRMPIGLSEAFLADSTARLRTWLPARPYADVPASLRDFRTLVIDGKTFKHAAKRLKPVRGRAGAGLGGKALVAMELATGLLVGMAADPDAHANEARLVPRLLPGVREQVPGPRLWMADRQFGDLAQTRRCTEHGDHCVFRLHKKSQFTVDAQQPVFRGVDAAGRAWVDERGTLHSSRQGVMPMRRITLQRPGREPIEIVTDLLDGTRYPANDLLELYRQRWGIEQVFQKVSEVFHLDRLIGSSPKAVVFQGAFCMVLYNLLQVVRTIIADTQDQPPAKISTFNLFHDLNRQLTVLHYLVPPDSLLNALRTCATSIRDLKAHLHKTLGQAWTKRWLKSPPKKHHPPPVKHKRGAAGHFSIHRVLLEHGKDV